MLAVLASAIPQNSHPEPAEAEPVCSADADAGADARCNSLAQLAATARRIHAVTLLEEGGLVDDKEDLVASARSLLMSAEAGIKEAAEAVWTELLPAQLTKEAEKVTDEADGRAERMARSLEAAAIGASAAVPGMSAIAATLKAAAPETAQAIEQSAAKEVKLLQEAASHAVKTISTELAAEQRAFAHGQVALMETSQTERVEMTLEQAQLKAREAKEEMLEAEMEEEQENAHVSGPYLEVKVPGAEALEEEMEATLEVQVQAKEESMEAEMEEERERSKVKVQGGASLMQTATYANWRQGARQLSLWQTSLSVGMFLSGLVCSALVVKQVREKPTVQRHRPRFHHGVFLERVDFVQWPDGAHETKPIQTQVVQ